MRDYELQTTNHGLRTTNYKPDDSPKEHCGVFGIYGHREAAKITYLGLYALQHRGEESGGIAIRAICKSSRRYSCTNNLNTMLSELGVNPEDPKFGDSWWELPTVEEAKELSEQAKELVSDRQFRFFRELCG